MMMYSRDKNKIREQRRDAEKRKHGDFRKRGERERLKILKKGREKEKNKKLP